MRLPAISRREAYVVGLGQSILNSANAPNFATLYVMLDEFPNRLSHDLSADAISANLQSVFNEESPGATVNVLVAPPGMAWERPAVLSS